MRASIPPLFQTLWQPKLNLHCHNHHECLFYSDFTRHSWDLTTQWESPNGNRKDSKVMKDTFSSNAIWALKKSGQTLGLEDRVRQERGKQDREGYWGDTHMVIYLLQDFYTTVSFVRLWKVFRLNWKT